MEKKRLVKFIGIALTLFIVWNMYEVMLSTLRIGLKMNLVLDLVFLITFVIMDLVLQDD